MEGKLSEVSNPVELADTHCHLNLSKFEEDRHEVIQRAKHAGIQRILVPGTNLSSSQQALNLSMKEQILYAAIGFQPNDSLEWQEGSQQDLRELYQTHLDGFDSDQKKVVAIGEIGLDYYWDAAPHHFQKEVLLEQLDLAAELNLPVVLHVREQYDVTHGACFDDLLEILGEWKTQLKSTDHDLSTRPGVIHSFSGDLDTAKEAISLGFYIGVTGPVTFNNAKVRQDTIKGIDLDHLLLETDAPYLTPHPKRGKRNEPCNIVLIAEKVAQLHETNLAEVATITNANAVKLFQW